MIIKNHKKAFLLLFTIPTYVFCLEPASSSNYEIRHVRIISRYLAKEPRHPNTQPYIEYASSAVITDEKHAIASAHALHKRNDTKVSEDHRLFYKIKAEKITILPNGVEDNHCFEASEFKVPLLWEDDNTPYIESLNYDVGLIFIPQKRRFSGCYPIFDLDDEEIGLGEDKRDVTVHGYHSINKGVSLDVMAHQNQQGNNDLSEKNNGSNTTHSNFLGNLYKRFNSTSEKMSFNSLSKKKSLISNTKNTQNELDFRFYTMIGKCEPYPNSDFPNIIRYQMVTRPGMSGGAGDYQRKTGERAILSIHSGNFLQEGDSSEWNVGIRMNEDIQNILCSMKDEFIWKQLNLPASGISGNWKNTHYMPVILIAQGRCAQEVKDYYENLKLIIQSKYFFDLDCAFDMCIGSNACEDFIYYTFHPMLKSNKGNNARILTITGNDLTYDSDKTEIRKENGEEQTLPINSTTYDPISYLSQNYDGKPAIILDLGVSDNSKDNHEFFLDQCGNEGHIYIRPNIYSLIPNFYVFSENEQNAEIMRILAGDFRLLSPENYLNVDALATSDFSSATTTVSSQSEKSETDT